MIVLYGTLAQDVQGEHVCFDKSRPIKGYRRDDYALFDDGSGYGVQSGSRTGGGSGDGTGTGFTSGFGWDNGDSGIL